MKNIIIGSPKHTKEIISDLIGSSSHLFNTSVRAFDFALKENELSNIEISLSVLPLLDTLNIPTIKEVIKYPATLESLVSFLKDLKNYRIDLDALPQDTPLYQDIHKVLKVIDQYITAPRIDTSSNISVYLNSLEHSQHQFLNSYDVQINPLPSRNPTNIRLKISLNIRHEIEAVIQEILRNNLDTVTIAVPNFASQTALIESVLQRYGFQSNLEDRSVHLAKVQYLSLLDFSYNPTRHTLRKVLEANALNMFYAKDIIFYIEHFDLSLEACMNRFDYAKDENNKQLRKIQDRIQSEILILQSFIQKSFENPYIDSIVSNYEIIRTNTKINTQPLHDFLLNHAHLFTEDLHPFLVYSIEKISMPIFTQENIKFIDIMDLPFNCVDNLYILNLNGSNYPSVSGKTGLIDELYLSKITGYPKTDVRTQYSLNQQARFLSMSKNLTLSYSVSTYEGKGLELSYPIESYCKQHGIVATPWSLEQVIARPQSKQKLSKNLAERIYLTDGKIVGSISSFELYTQDPIAYFIERGLNLREPELPVFDARVLGTLNHAIVEFTDDDKTAMLWDEISLSYPIDSPFIKMIKRRNDYQMSVNLQHLKEIDSSSRFNTMSREKYFVDHSIHPKIELRGIIDRIDYTDDKLLIIDYKTSALTLSPKKIMTGQQLQLITYALIASSMFKKNVLGIFYYGFKLPNIKHPYMKYSAAKGVIANQSTVSQSWTKEKQLSGWFFQTPLDEFDSAEHFKSLKIVKDGSLSVGTPFSFEITKHNILSIYDDIQRNILDGILDPRDIKFTLAMDTPFKEGKEEA